MAYHAIEVANYTINKCADEEKPVTNLRLQKLLYFMWIDYYAETKRYLFEEEICAWRLGPVVPNVYYKYCAYAGIPILSAPEASIADTDRAILDATLGKYKNVTTSRLVNKTHLAGCPWHEVYANGGGDRRRIPFELLERSVCAG